MQQRVMALLKDKEGSFKAEYLNAGYLGQHFPVDNEMEFPGGGYDLANPKDYDKMSAADTEVIASTLNNMYF